MSSSSSSVSTRTGRRGQITSTSRIITRVIIVLATAQTMSGFFQPAPTSIPMRRTTSTFIDPIVNGPYTRWHKSSSHGPSSLVPLSASPRKIDVGLDNSLMNFGRDLTKHNLLTASDEFFLARQYKLGLQIKAQRVLMTEELGRPVTDNELAAALGLASAEQVEYLSTKGKDAKKALVKTNMRLVFHICKYYRFRGVAYPDLIQEGTFGLMKAVDKYDPDRGFRFSTYASWWIKQSVSRAIAEKSRIVRLPVHIHDLMVTLTRVERQFIAQNSRKPSSQELADRLALPLQKVELLVKCSRDVNSIDVNVYDSAGKAQPSNNEVQVKDRLMSETVQPTLLNERNSIRTELRRAMHSLSLRESQIVEMRFGLTDRAPMTLEEIGKEYGVTRERIRQIEARALAKMRAPAKVQEVREIFQDHSLRTAGIPSSRIAQDEDALVSF